MAILELIIALGLAGTVVWLITTYLPFDGKIKKILNTRDVSRIGVWSLPISEFPTFMSDKTLCMQICSPRVGCPLQAQMIPHKDFDNKQFERTEINESI